MTTNSLFVSQPLTFRLFSAASSDSIRFHSNLLSHDNDLRVSIDNTCTDSLVTALDDEALLINDYMNDMSRSKVRVDTFFRFSWLLQSFFIHEGSFWWCVPLWDAKGRALAESTGDGGKDIIKLSQEPASSMVPTNRQSAGNETLRQQKGTR